MKSWYVATTHAARERLAVRELERQGFQTFYPRERIRVMRAGEMRLTIRPLFPGYIFIRFDAMRDRWRSINGTRGVGYLFTCGEVPTRVRRGVVEAIIASCVDGYASDARVDEIIRETALRCGEHVTVKSGAFAGHAGVVNERLRVMLNLFGRSTEVRLPASELVRSRSMLV